MKHDILRKIVAFKKEEVAAARRQRPLQQIKERLDDAPPARSFADPLRLPGEVALIAEVKRRSPSRGLIRADFNLVKIVTAYRDAGADAISVLTDSEFFGGSHDYLAAARRITGQPLLRKDFIIYDYQVYESRLLGADAVLLIAGILPGDTLGELIELTRSLGMEALVETHTAEEIERALAVGAKVVGINNRDLRTFQVDLNTTIELMGHINDPSVTVVSESGIRTSSDIERLGARGVHAVLVGETLMAGSDLRAGVRYLRCLASERAAVEA
ncbi:MAG TPA: indole-3-glycerol phosphate synthase TrpC [Desulfotomaculum sp.]|nr:MAG: indole-3-glycerol phosphate synthase [Desulfotomaculum sp. BICA1-6]HBX24471.1 indole-3-glycerol phosphate synthase TrpC [Desulfotomaculum sp.]